MNTLQCRDPCFYRAGPAARSSRRRGHQGCRSAGRAPPPPETTIRASLVAPSSILSGTTSSSPRPGRRRQSSFAAARAAAPNAANDAQRLAALDAATSLYTRAWSRGEIKLLDVIMAPDHVQNDAIWQPEGRSSPPTTAANANAATSDRRAATSGRDRMKRGILAYRIAYPDVRFEVLDAAAAPTDQPNLWRVFVHWRAAGTNLGPIRDAPPTGRRAEFSGVNVATVLVVERQPGNWSAQIVRSDVYRQAPADEAAYFLTRGGADALASAGRGSGGDGGAAGG